MTTIRIADPAVGMLSAMLAARGHRSRLVGGAVRDIVCGMEPKDMDLATDALPEAVIETASAAGLRVIPTGLQHGTVTVVVDGTPYEITTLRRDVETDGRHALVEYVTDFRLDAARRDFTFNAMSAEASGQVHDYFGGVADLSARRVRFVGSPDDRIAEDYLRILRFFRFRARFGGAEDRSDLEAVAAGRAGLSGISVERVWSEVSRIIMHPRGPEQLASMRATGVAAVIGLPVDDGLSRAAAAAAMVGGRAGTVLGVLCGSPVAADEIAARWKLSGADAADAAVAARVIADTSSAPEHWIGAATDGLDVTAAIPVLEATGRTQAAEALKGPIPVFPLRGRDLLEAGFDPGPGIGAMMAIARNEWKTSGFTAGKDELLASATAPETRRP